ncbi:MAG: SDR family oxidoreductase, partial [Bdellovibrionales bacterium]|nr:SDR family oxidoreductase [Bdellovibrionales bacterium]
VFETNTLAPLRLCQALVPLMNAQGCIVNVSSGMGSLHDMGGSWPGYRISKAGLNALTRILAAELSTTGIRVNAVCPGWVRTSMGGPKAARSVEEGADTIVWAACLPPDGQTGGFFRDRKAVPW